MHCEQCETLLPLLVFDEIEDGDKAQVLEHLSHCGSCSEKLGDLRITFNLLRDGINAAPAPVLSADRRTRLLATLAREPARSKRKTKKAIASKKRPGIFTLFNKGTPAQRLLAIAATLAFSAALVSALLPSLGSARRSVRMMSAVVDSSDSMAKDGRHDAEEAIIPTARLSELSERGGSLHFGSGVTSSAKIPSPAENRYLQTLERPSDNMPERLAYADSDRGGGRGGRGGQGGEMQSFNSPVPPPVVRSGGTGEQGEREPVVARFSQKEPPVVGSRSGGVDGGKRSVTKSASSTGEKARQPGGETSPSESDIRWGIISGSAFAPAKSPATGDAPLNRPGQDPGLVPPADSDLVLPLEPRSLKREQESSLAQGSAKDNFARLSGGRDGKEDDDKDKIEAEAVLDGIRRVAGNLAEDTAIGGKRLEAIKKHADMKAGSDEQPLIRESLGPTEYKYRQEEPFSFQTQQGENKAEGGESFGPRPSGRGLNDQQGQSKAEGGESADGSAAGKYKDHRYEYRLDLSGALGDIAPPNATTPLVRGPQQGPGQGQEQGEEQMEGFSMRRPQQGEGDRFALNLKVPNFSAAPEFDLNAAIDNTKTTGGQPASGVTLFDDADESGRRQPESTRSRDEQVQRLLHRALELRKTGDDGRSLQLIDQALFLDPANPAAETMKRMVEDPRITVKDKEYLRLRNTRFARHSTETDGDGKPKGGNESTTTLFSDGNSNDDSDGEQATREEKIEQIATLIRDNVGKQTDWTAYGGEVSSVQELNHKLIIKATATQHRQVTDLLNKLRVDQAGRPLPAIQVPGETEADRAVSRRLQQRVNLNLEGRKLEEAVRELEEKAGGNLVVNWQALEAAGVERDLGVSLRLKDVPAETALKLMLTQAGAGAELEPIDYEVVNGVVNISTRRDLDRNTATQVYDVRDLLNQPLDAKDGQALARQLKEAEAREKELLAKQAEQAREEAEKAAAQAMQEQQARMRQVDEGQLQPAAAFRIMPVNPWTLTQEDAQSTFALDVDTASYTLGRRYLERGFLPPQGSVRMEEYVNAFDYNYVNNSDQVFRIYASAAPAPFATAGEQDIKLVKVGVKGKVIGRDGRKPANLVLVVDTSGSMARQDRLPLVQHSLELLTEQLSPHDTVSLVTFGSQVLTLLDRTPASNKQQIIAAIRSLQSNGPTNLLKGVEAGYRLAATAHRSGAINRVILCSDGIATLGESEADTILGYVEKYRKQGISCTTVGVGAGAYDDDMMEKLANRGDGTYHFIDSPREAKRVFVDEITATLQTIAQDAKIQVEFDPRRVRRYRLIGYENRAVADKDFRNDAIDAGEVGSGQSSTALYEVELIGDERADLGTVYVRYRNTDTMKIEEISHRLTASLVQDRSPESDPRFYLAACAAEFAEVLRGSEHATGGSLPRVQRMLERTVPHLPLDEKARELLNLVRQAQGLPRAP